jgi:hypothetical protein
MRQRDVTRAIKAAKAAGVTLERVWIEADGKIVLGIANGHSVEADNKEVNEWDAIFNDKRPT